MSNTNSRDGSGSEVRILDILAAVARRKRIFITAAAVGAAAGILLALLVPRQYQSMARVLPPKSSDLLSGLGAVSSLVKSLPLNVGKLGAGAGSESYDYIALVRSRTVLEAVVRKYDLMEVYDIADSSMEKTLKELKGNLDVDWTDDNVLEIQVWDEDAGRAAGMANEFVDLLNRRNFELQTQQARNAREFIGKRLEQNRADLRAAEDSLRAYQDDRKMIVPLDAGSSGVSGMAELYVDKVKKEIELDILRSTAGTENQLYRQAKLEYDALMRNIDGLPAMGIATLRLYRDLVIQQKIMEMIVPLYEQAKVDEHKDVPVAYVLDPGVPGERPERPKRLLVAGIVLFLSLVVGSAIVGAAEYRDHLESSRPEDLAKFRELGAMIGIRRRK
jgi:tyrosine-protein kinase Etk/Wzc